MYCIIYTHQIVIISQIKVLQHNFSCKTNIVFLLYNDLLNLSKQTYLLSHIVNIYNDLLRIPWHQGILELRRNA